MNTRLLALAIALSLPSLPGAALGFEFLDATASPADRITAAAAANPLAELVRQVNGRFQDVNVALAEGYGPIPCADGRGGGSMGIHFVNANNLADDAIDISQPEAVMYEPQPDGSLELVAVEYITFAGPAALEGHLFSFTGSPNRYGLDPFYELHVWAWRDNPSGTFADLNPTVSCEAAALDAD